VDGKEPEDTSLQRAVQDECQRTASSEKDLPSPCMLRHGSLHPSPVMLLTMICACYRAWKYFIALIAKLQKLPLK